MRSNTREFIVGIVFFALMGALAVLTLVLSADVLNASEEVVFRFENVSGLAPGSDVWMNGLPAGTVKSIDIQPDGTLLATARMRHPLKDLSFDSGVAVTVKSKSALGGSVIAGATGLGKETGVGTLPELLERTWKARKDAFETISDEVGGVGIQFKDALDEVRSLARDAREGKGLLATLINDPQVAADVKAAAASLRKVTEGVERGEGSLGKLLKDDGIHDDLKAALADIRNFTKEMNEGKGLLHRLAYDEKLGEDLSGAVADLKGITADVRAGKGTMGRLFTDDALFVDLKAAAADISSFTRQMNDGNGLLHRLAYDDKLGSDVEAAVADIRDMFADIRAGKGTLGKLMTDEELYADVRDAVRALQRSFEESRENAPILTFAGFLFKTF